MTSSPGPESFWLSSPLVGSGTVRSGCSGHFRTAGTVDVVLDQHNELHLLSVTGGRLEPAFKQPLFCTIKQMAVLPFSLAQPPNMQTQVLDHLLLLLENGSLMVLKYSQVVQRFYIAAETQLAAGNTPDPDYLGARMTVSPQPTAPGLAIAVSAKRGRIACLTASLDTDGAVQLSKPVLYAMPAPRVLGASYQYAKREMELGDIMDLVLLPAGNSQEGQEAGTEHLAVLSHRPDEVASHLVLFSWDRHEQQLKKLGSVSVENRAGAAGFGIPLYLARVPSCPTAVLIIREWGLLLLECSAVMQPPKPGQQVERCCMECTQQLAYRFQEQQQPYQQWARHHHLHIFAAKCVLPSLKQSFTPGRRVWQASACDAEASTPTGPMPATEAEAAMLTHDAAAAVAAALQEAAEQDAAAAAATEMLPEAAVAAAVDGFAAPAAADAAEQDLYNIDHGHFDGGAQVVQQAAAAGVDADAAAVAVADATDAGADDMIVDYDHPYYEDDQDQDEQYYGGNNIEPEEHFLDAEVESSTAAEAEAASGATGTRGSDSGAEGDEVSPPATEQQHEPSWTPGSSAGDGRTAAVVEPTSITAVAWASSTLRYSPPAAAGLQSNHHSTPTAGSPISDSPAAPAAAADAGAVTGYLLVATSCGCLLQLHVSLSPRDSSMWTPQLFQGCTGALPFRHNNCINILHTEKIYEVQVPTVSNASSNGSRMGPVLLSLPQQQLLLVADDQSQVLLLQQRQQEQAPLQAGQGAEHTDASAAAAAHAGTDSPGDVTAREVDQQPSQACAAASASAAPAPAGGPAVGPVGDPGAPAAEGMDIDAQPSGAAAAVAADVPGNGSSRPGKKQQLGDVLAALKAQAAAGQPHGNSSPAAAASTDSPQAATAAVDGPAAAAAADGLSAGQSSEQYVVTDQLQLLGKVGSMVAFPRMASHQPQQQQQQQPLLVAARPGCEGGMRLLSHACNTTQLLRGPAGMFEGVSGMWPIAASPDSSSSSSEDVALVFSFTSGATRALSVGTHFLDVTEVMGLQASQGTLLAACVAEGVAVQVTQSSVRLCCLDALLSCNNEGGGRGWRGSPKSSRPGMGTWQQPLQQQQQQQQQQGAWQASRSPVTGTCSNDAVAKAPPGSSMPAGAATSSGARQTQQPSRLAVSSAAETAADAPTGDASVGDAGGEAAEQPAPAAAAAAVAAADDVVLAGQHQGTTGIQQPGAQLLQGYSACQAGSDSSLGSLSSTSAAQLQHDGHWHLQADPQQQQSAAIVLAAAAAGVVVVYSNTGKLVTLSVRCAQQPRQQQQHQRGLNLDPLDLNSDGATPPPAAAAAALAVEGSSRLAASGNSGSSGSSGGTSKKRARSSWGLVESGSMQLDGQVSCLQVVAGSAAVPASPGTYSSSSSSGGGGSSRGLYVIFVGRYDGSLQLLTLHAATGALQPLATFEETHLLALQYLASVLRESASEAGGGALSPADALQSAAAPVAVPESCVVLPSWAVGGASGSSAAGAGVRGAGRRGKHAALAASAAAAAAGGGSAGTFGADDSSSGCMQFVVSYRTGDVAAYRLNLLSLLQQQQQQTATGPVHVSADSALRVVSQQRLPSITKLQLLPQQRQQHLQQPRQQVLAVGGQVWLLELDRVTQRLTSCDVTTEPVLLASALSLPAAGAGAGPAAGAVPPGSASSGQQQQQQLPTNQHMVVATADGQLQLLRLRQQQQGRSLQVNTWLPHTNVSHLVQHPSTNLLLAACSGHASPFSAEGLAGRDLGADESVWLQALDPCTGARLAAYLLSRNAGQYVTCLDLWDTTWKPQWGAGKGGSSSGEQDTAAAAAGGAGDVVMRDAGAAAAGGGGGNEGMMVFRRAGRWWQRLRHRASLRGEGEDVPQQGEPGQQQQRSEARHRPRAAAGRARHHAGPAAAAAAAADGSSSGSEHFFQLGSLLKGLDSPVSGEVAVKAHSSGRSNQGSTKTVKQRKGPLILLGTEAYGDLDGCNGQVLVLQLMCSSRVGVGTTQQGPRVPRRGSAAAAAVVGVDAGCSSAAGQKGASDAGIHAEIAGRSHGCSSSGSSSRGGSWSIQLVARLRLPDAVSALAAFSEDLLLVATRQVLALFQLKQDRLVKAAYCFTRAPVTSLSPAPAPVVSAAGGGTTGGSSAGLVFAADALMGVTVFQVNLHAATGQYSLQPIGMHCDVRQVSQVLCLPQALQPPAPAAVVRTVKLAEAATAPLPAAGQQQQEQLGIAGHRLQGQQQPRIAGGRAAAAVGRVSTSQLPAAGGDSLNQVQHMLEAGLRGLCLDEEGAVVEFGWARHRTVPAKWMRTLACIALGGRAAAGSLHAIGSNLGASSGMQQQQRLQVQGARLTGLLPGHSVEQDGLPLHWLPLAHSGRAAAVVAAAANGGAVCLQRLPAAEGQLLLALQQLLLRHPLTSRMVLGRRHLLPEEPSQQQSAQHPAAAAGTPTLSKGQQAVGLAPGELGVVDAKVLSVFLCLPCRMQQLLLDSSVWRACGGGGTYGCGAAQLQDGLRCRLQLLLANLQEC